MPSTKKNHLASVVINCTLTMAISLPGIASAYQSNGADYSSGVLAACKIIGANMAFGSYTSSQVDQNGNIAITCTNGVSYSVALDAGIGTDATTKVRKLIGLAGDTLNYVLYRDPARTSVWGSQIGTDTASGTGTGIVQSLTIYGRIPGGQSPLSGVYSDTVTIMLTY
jgi:spore coat protein U-like protein